MTSPLSSTLLQQPVESHPRPRRPLPMHGSSITHVVAEPQPTYAPQPAYAPQPQVSYVQAAPSGPGRATSAISTVLLAVLVLLVGIVALAGGYFAAKAAAPSSDEAAVTRSLAAQQGYAAGRDSGYANGHGDALVNAESTAALRASVARSRVYNAAYKRGFAAGSKYRAPARRSYGGGGYRAPSYRGFGNSGYAVSSALGQAQNLANITGAPVDVEIY
ncbi:MAG: hypothetical protein JWM98_2668 [Thermoleophilia bacterium]|nr:hypothetical protein [Thermoleophilia bacterium]